MKINMIANYTKSDLPNLSFLTHHFNHQSLGWHRAGENYSLKMIKCVEENINQSNLRKILQNEIRKKNITAACGLSWVL